MMLIISMLLYNILEVVLNILYYTKRFFSMKMVKFTKFLIIWISQNLAIPFWVVGHIHLSIHNFHDLIEIGASIGMNLIVAIGFFLDYRENSCK